MKTFIVLALCFAVALKSEAQYEEPPTVTGMDAAEVQPIIDIIYHPSTDPLTATALEEMLLEILGISKPVIIQEPPVDVIPEIVIEAGQNEEFKDGPIIVDKPYIPEPIYRPPVEQSNEAKPKPEREHVVVVEKSEIPEEVIVTPIII